LKRTPVIRRLEVRYRDLDPYGHVNNAVYLEFFETLQFAYWRRLAENLGVELETGDLPGARHVVAENRVRYVSPVFLDDELYGAASISSVGNRSYTMEYELRVGKSFEEGELAAEGSAAHVFYDPEAGSSRPRPDWFLSAVAELEGVPEEDLLR